MLATCASSSCLPSWIRAIVRIASSSVVIEPSWNQGPVFSTLRSDGTLKNWRSASFFVTSKRPRPSSDTAPRAELLEQPAADRRPHVAGGAAGVEEGLEPRHLAVGERVVVALEERVEAIGGDEPALERADRAREVVVADGILLVREGRLEQRQIARDRADHGDHLRLARHPHLDRIQHRALRLRLDVGARPSQNCATWNAAL